MTSKHTKTAATPSGKGGEQPAGSGMAAAEHAGRTVQQGVAASLSALDAVETQIAGLARKTIVDTVGIGGGTAISVTSVVEHVVRGALAASEEVGTGLALSVRGVAKGIVAGVHDVGGDVVLAAFDTMRALIQVGATLGADLGAVARHAVGGILDAVGETGGDAGRIGKRAAEGAIAAASEISNMAVGAVRDVLVGISGSAGKVAGAVEHAQAAGTPARHH